MNVALNTTGLVPFTVGSVNLFTSKAFANGLPWDLTGGTVTLNMKDSNGAFYSYPATITGMVAQVSWTVLNVPGRWTRSWTVTDAQGRHQVSRAYTFDVEPAP